MMPSLLQTPGPPPGGNRGGVGLFLLVVVVGIVLILRRRGTAAGPPLPPADARHALEEMEKDGRRDARAEGHIGAFMSWCRAYAVLMVFSCVFGAYQASKARVDPDEPPPNYGTFALFGGIALIEFVGLWGGGRWLARGESRGRWLSCAALTAVSASGATAVALRILNWTEDDVFDVNLLSNGVLAVYALAAATFLILPRTARLCAPEYRAAAGSAETSAIAAALRLARAKSPFSWIPILGMLAAFALHAYNRNHQG